MKVQVGETVSGARTHTLIYDCCRVQLGKSFVTWCVRMSVVR